VCCLVGKTYSGGTFSPNVRASLAIFFRRNSDGEGARGSSSQVGVLGIFVIEVTNGEYGESGIRLSEGCTGMVLTRKTNGRGASADRRGFDEKDFGVGRTSTLEQGSGNVRDDTDEFVDEE